MSTHVEQMAECADWFECGCEECNRAAEEQGETMPIIVKLPCGCVAETENGSPDVEFVEACGECARAIRESARGHGAEEGGIDGERE